MTKTLSDKNTKTEILEAYNDLLEKMKEQKAMDVKAIKKEVEEKETVKKASQHSVEGIVQNMADLKLEIIKSMDGLGERLITEYKKLTELQQAIDVETKTIEDIYNIKVEAESLTALIAAQRDKRVAFEAEMEQKKADFDNDITQKRFLWKKEQDDFEFVKKEREAQSKKERQREEEDYLYNLQLKRKKEADAYEGNTANLEKGLTEKKAAFEKEFSEREANLSAREKELADLKIRVESFPKELEEAIKDAEKSVTERLNFTYSHEAELASKEIEGDRKLYQQKIAALESKISEQDDLIKQLTQKANEAGLQVQSIAIKAIEGASSQRITVERERVREG
ncbi:MAG: hypothetical protein NT178_16065 [Proteobacteria bacterium]|nr:hypothetical protein [Pseudomonadota bacterium]